MFNRILASIGIGSATIDTLLEKDRYQPGETLHGVVRIRGGSVEQRIEAIHVVVMTEYIKESNDNKYRQNAEVARYNVSQPIDILAGQTQEIAFSFDLPLETPLTIGHTPVWLKTELDIRGAVDPGDKDRIDVSPTRAMNTVFEALDVLDFRLRKAECEYASRLGGRFPFVQEFEYVPTRQFRGKLDELEVIFFHGGNGNGLELLLQIDRRARGLASLFAEAMDMDESFVRIRLTNEQLTAGKHAVARQLEDVIERFV
jgi:sporulation-control protein